MTRNNLLRIGLIMSITGVVVLIHLASTNGGRIPRPLELVIGVALAVLGVPFLVAAGRR